MPNREGVVFVLGYVLVCNRVEANCDLVGHEFAPSALYFSQLGLPLRSQGVMYIMQATHLP